MLFKYCPSIIKISNLYCQKVFPISLKYCPNIVQNLVHFNSNFGHFIWSFWAPGLAIKNDLIFIIHSSTLILRPKQNFEERKSQFRAALTSKNGHFRAKKEKNETTSAIHSSILPLWLKQNFEILKGKNLIFWVPWPPKMALFGHFRAKKGKN